MPGECGYKFQKKVWRYLDRWGVEQKIFTLINEEENVNAAVKTALSCTLAEQAAVLKTWVERVCM